MGVRTYVRVRGSASTNVSAQVERHAGYTDDETRFHEMIPYLAARFSELFVSECSAARRMDIGDWSRVQMNQSPQMKLSTEALGKAMVHSNTL